MKMYKFVLAAAFVVLLYILYAHFAPNLKLAEKFRNSLELNYKDKALDYKEHEYIVLDVTKTVQNAGIPAAEAKLTIYTGSLFKMKIIKVGKTWPTRYPDGREADPSIYSTAAYVNIVKNWINDQEWERQTDPGTGITYWVVYPCKLELTPSDLDVSKYLKTNTGDNSDSSNNDNDDVHFPTFPGFGWP